MQGAGANQLPDTCLSGKGRGHRGTAAAIVERRIVGNSWEQVPGQRKPQWATTHDAPTSVQNHPSHMAVPPPELGGARITLGRSLEDPTAPSLPAWTSSRPCLSVLQTRVIYCLTPSPGAGAIGSHTGPGMLSGSQPPLQRIFTHHPSKCCSHPPPFTEEVAKAQRGQAPLLVGDGDRI